MNIFEEFVEELKQENLLEDTVTDSKSEQGDKSKDSLLKDKNDEKAKKESSETKDENDPADEAEDGTKSESEDSTVMSVEDEDLVLVENDASSEKLDESGNDNEGNNDFELDIDESADEDALETDEEAGVFEKEDYVDVNEPKEETNKEPVVTKAIRDFTKSDPNKEKEAYRQRLVDNVSGLQMVDHILSGVQREQKRMRPEPFDSLPVKQALHKFFEAFYELDVPETTTEESELLKEIEIWHSALLDIDKKISVADLRRYCESTKPPLSAQASLSLVRFYRNSPFSEDVRAKFDLVATRLFTKEIEDGKREMVFERDELIEHVKELYADWASTPLYSEDEDDSEIVLAAFKFEDFIDEAAKVAKFDDLIKKGFFKRIKLFKKKTNENFFAPLLVAAAVESNVVIGNRYEDLIEEERLRADSKKIDSKYGETEDQAVSEAKSKSSQIAELVNKGKQSSAESVANSVRQGFLNTKISYIVLGALAFIVVSLLVWNLFLGGGSPDRKDLPGPAAGRAISIDDASFKEYIASPTIKGKTLSVVATSSWDGLALEEREKTLKEILDGGKTRGYSKVRVSNSGGNVVGFASKSGINVVE